MKVLISARGDSLDAEVDPRFGRCAYLMLVDAKSRTILSAERNEYANAAGGAGTRTARRAVDLNAEVILTGKIGPKALEVLQECGVRYCTGASGSVRDALDAFARGDLSESASNPGSVRG
ncbi:MAG: NifB/NifX family molybdenum-iron cluster-binding protein [Planctomycetota bacterium]